ncbi:Transmembrane protein 62 [Apophysomyces ossiformis]|uniref:Transmembrane protein 62 n=1 Tax=Apophysomyces ossiformis TaxID=679940 RepID=A0A8H7BF30_9FUNG|nr:Transmembrane protein 62 [Apophysomyces ossiformis]
MIRPSFVVVTGDLTDAKDRTRLKSKQYIEEWQVYQSAIDEKVDVPWYDMRGNHDCFDLASWKSLSNFYRVFGKSADLVEDGQGVYSWTIEKPFGRYQFVAVDACPKRGPSRPFNFFGYLTRQTMDRLEEALTSGRYNHTFMLSHYPTTTMVTGTSSKGQTFRDLARHFSVYLCGHLHRLVAGLGDVLQSYNIASDSLELEVADMKDHGVYRIVAVDNDLISFVDVELPLSQIQNLPAQPAIPLSDNNTIQWPPAIRPAPVILITNPKSAQFVLDREPVDRMANSNHIRFLIFSEIAPERLKVRIFLDDKKHLLPAKYVGGDSPLWISEWEANDFNDLEAHRLRVQVTTPDGETTESEIVFRVDGVRTEISGFGQWIISSTLSSTFRRASIFAVLAFLALLLIPRLLLECKIEPQPSQILLKIHAIDNGDLMGGPYQGFYRQYLVWSLRFLQLPEDQPVVWYGTLGIMLSLMSLPWFRAEFIPSGTTESERFGVLYMWGLRFANDWIPLADTWVFAFFKIVFDVGVFYLLFAWRVVDTSDLHCRNSEKAKRHVRQLHEHKWFKCLEVLYWLWRASELVSLASCYGGLWPTLIFNLLSVWLLFVAVMLVGGKQGLLSNRQRQQRIGISLEGCPDCGLENTVVLHTASPRTENEDGIVLTSSTVTDEDLQSSSTVFATSSQGRLRVKSRKRGQ